MAQRCLEKAMASLPRRLDPFACTALFSLSHERYFRLSGGDATPRANRPSINSGATLYGKTPRVESKNVSAGYQLPVSLVKRCGKHPADITS